MKYYAHTTEGVDGKPLPEDSGKWQKLASHLSNVAELAGQIISPFLSAGSIGMKRPTGFSPDRVSIMGISMFQSAPNWRPQNIIDFRLNIK